MKYKKYELGGLSTAGLITGGIGALGNIASNIYAARQGKKQMQEGTALYNKMLEDLQSGKYDRSVSQATLQAAEEQKQLASAAAQTAEERARAAQQAYISGIRSGDRRMAAAIPGAFAGMERGAQDAQAMAARQQAAASQRVAGLEEGYKQQNIAMQEALAKQQMERGARAAEAGRQMRYGAFGNIAGDIMGVGSAMFGAGLDAPLKENAGSESNEQNVSSLLNFLQQYGPVQSSKIGAPLDDPYYVAKKGMRVQKTPGKFSHEENPIDMVAEDGTKVGEVTGGEYIFNPKQTNTIKTMISSNNKDGLFKFLKGLLNKERFK